MCYRKIDDKIRNSSYFKEFLYRCDNGVRLVTFLNPFSYLELMNNAHLIDEFDSFFVDGSLLVKLHNYYNKNVIDRVSFDFSSIASIVFDYANSNNMNVSFIGAMQDEVVRAVANINSVYPNMNVVYYRDGYFTDADDYNECFNTMSRKKIDILVVGMGSPYQEKFAVKVKDAGLQIPLIFTCGGFLTQTSIKMNYYNPIVEKLGLRWLQRAIMHKHVRVRLIKEYPLFIYNYIYNHRHQR